MTRTGNGLSTTGRRTSGCNGPGARVARTLAADPGTMNLLSFALILVATFPSHAAAQSSGSAHIAIVDAPGTGVATALRRDLGRPFEPPRPCEIRQPGGTVREVLGPSVRAILVHNYDRPAWRNMTVVGDYIRRVLDARPEAGDLQPNVYWAEGSRAEVVGSSEFSSGRLSRIEFANGYAHVEDAAGCQWWGRYLGGDRDAWVVRE